MASTLLLPLTLPPKTAARAKRPLGKLPATKAAPTKRPLASSKKYGGPRLITAAGKNVCLLCRSARRHKKRCPTQMERVRSDYIMDVPEVAVATAPPITTCATKTTDDDNDAYSSVGTESETRLFHHFLPRCPADDFGAMATQWNTLLRAWRLSDCVEIEVTTGCITLADVMFKTPQHLATYARSVAPVPTAKPRRRRREDNDDSSPNAASKRQYLPCPHCGHKTRRHYGDVGDKCALFVYYKLRSFGATSYTFDQAILDFEHFQKPLTLPQQRNGSYIV
ncbi:hypothetical protein SDRG_17297 [Saprolegnia diclina VS20]|uniref:Uncharacterized protein n=1 Tax=Saprolegnia diclina (strain VS20) TaxID=1156394 RepID=T0R5J8_SAPDV|nr:hypothetical protein SDRG_17297 [Saprolegnia diclina VS20]XP_008621790.1 hypothetical protein SDRG_17327 [Saprolegnia diclina VS20]EQC24782.1 hypothetical protein SDRG_17327 [Saprolegnia diclina VS20]EQC24812.1 hypothetical protein SDRG_17297 [Saprolegnia diclina VS20]|eukprot:XP_008621759.1 hypothetical protein SDRG_17297 [Saprolegnia diclina VS20]